MRGCSPFDRANGALGRSEATKVPFARSRGVPATGCFGVFWVRESPPTSTGWGASLMCVRRCPTLPHPVECSTIGAEGLSFRVRNGAGRFPFAMAAVTLWRYQFSGWVPVCISGTAQWTRSIFVGQVVGLLVPVSSTHCCASTSGLSTQ